MKRTLLLTIIAILFAGSAYCQIPEVMVGDTSFVKEFIQPWCYSDNPSFSFCGSFDFRIGRHSNDNFLHYIKVRKTSTDNKDSDFVFFVATDTSTQKDSVVYASLWECDTGRNLFSCGDSLRIVFIAKGIDSIIAIRRRDSIIFLPLDTPARKYKPFTAPFYFYSNIADSVLFDSWQLVIDPTAQISFTIDSNTSPISEYLSKPFTRKKQLNFTFTSSLPATDTAHSFPATMKTRVRYKGVDSIYSNTFTIVLPAAPKSGVRSDGINDVSFTINPNPLSKQTTFTITTPRSESVTIEIYDILGNRKRVIANGELIEGSRAFHMDASGLATGRYYVRLTIGEKVISKSIIIN